MAYRDVVLPMRPTGYWPLDERSGAAGAIMRNHADPTTVLDAVLTTGGSAAPPVLSNGERGASMRCNGLARAAVDGTPVTSLDTGTLTLACWFLTSGPGGSAALMGRGSDATEANNPYTLRFNGAGTQLFGFLGAGGGVTQNLSIGAAAALTDGRLHMVAFTADGSNMRGYIDGRLVNGPTTQTVTPYSGSGLSLFLGGAFANFNGTLAHASFWRRAISTQEVATLWRAGRLGAGRPWRLGRQR